MRELASKYEISTWSTQTKMMVEALKGSERGLEILLKEFAKDLSSADLAVFERVQVTAGNYAEALQAMLEVIGRAQ